MCRPDDCRECAASSFQNGAPQKSECRHGSVYKRLVPTPMWDGLKIIDVNFIPPHWCPIPSIDFDMLTTAERPVSEFVEEKS